MKPHRITVAVVSIILTFAIVGHTQQRPGEAPAGPAQEVQRLFGQARQGDRAAVDKAVALLERATSDAPQDASLWTLLGRAYFLRLAMLARTNADPESMAVTTQRAREALDRALQLTPSDASALVAHGMGLTILAGIRQDEALMTKGVQEMNDAVAINPAATHIRLTRAFTMVNLPGSVRHIPTVVEDLSLGVDRARSYNELATQTLRLLLGDVFAETGQTDRARREYEAAATGPLTGAQQARERVAALEKGTVPAAAIRSLRDGLVTNCTMCHAR